MRAIDAKEVVEGEQEKTRDWTEATSWKVLILMREREARAMSRETLKGSAVCAGACLGSVLAGIAAHACDVAAAASGHQWRLPLDREWVPGHPGFAIMSIICFAVAALGLVFAAILFTSALRLRLRALDPKSVLAPGDPATEDEFNRRRPNHKVQQSADVLRDLAEVTGADSPTSITCPSCGTKLEVPPHNRHVVEVTCPACKAPFVLYG